MAQFVIHERFLVTDPDGLQRNGGDSNIRIRILWINLDGASVIRKRLLMTTRIAAGSISAMIMRIRMLRINLNGARVIRKEAPHDDPNCAKKSRDY